MNLKPAQLHQQKTYPPIDEKPSNPEFPSARYFQVHFEHLESQLLENNRHIKELQKQMAELSLTLALLKPEKMNRKAGK